MQTGTYGTKKVSIIKSNIVIANLLDAASYGIRQEVVAGETTICDAHYKS